MGIARSIVVSALAVAFVAAGAIRAEAVTVPSQTNVSAAERAALSKPNLTAEQQQLYLSIKSRLTAAQFARLEPTIARVRAVLAGERAGDPSTLAHQGVASAFGGAGPRGHAALVYIVMVEAENHASSDRIEKIEHVDRLLAQKAAIRSQIAQANGDTTSLQSKLTAISDMSSEEQLEIQMAMSQFNQFEETLSNIMKSFAGVQNGIIDNIKE
jgi:hypothetical protein